MGVRIMTWLPAADNSATSGAAPCGGGTIPEAKIIAPAATTSEAKVSERQKTAEFQRPRCTSAVVLAKADGRERRSFGRRTAAVGSAHFHLEHLFAGGDRVPAG